ncbi:type I polyketide synthase [Crossiella cryophila]|uniref:type I polyketide synthase n=1 Tax=Crossiella cryophila TaxID=43355 RepID=UPI0031EF3088
MANEEQLRSYLKRAIADSRELQRRLREVEDRQTEPIAIVGMACRFPGGVSTPDQLWDLVASGGDAVGGFPADRGWDLDELVATGTSATAEGGFLDRVGEFDADFFGISPREALATDPQQRLLLETSWEALEHAGIDPLSLAETQAGVFVGTFPSGYTEIAGQAGADVAGHLITGGSQSVASGRIAYTLGLRGPALTVDTACSSSLVALHLAAQSLRSGESPLALVGGVTVMATPGTFIGFSAQGGMAADGRCKAFAEAADGAGWAEGVGVLVVQRLSDAIREGRPVLAVVRATAVNQDGASNGLTAPNGPAQQQVIRQALTAAGLEPSEVDAVEGHGTGTVLGDPIEAQALLATYGQDRERPLYLGSLKSNLGHAQAAAGVAGIIKMVQALRHKVLPAALHVDQPSSTVDWSAGSVELLTESRSWPETGRPRRAGVSSFGVSGTNAHVILESVEPVTAPEPAAATVPWVLSARTPEALRTQAARLLERAADAHPVDVAWSLARTRAALPHRLAVTGDQLAALRAFAEDSPSPHVHTGQARTGGVAVLFSGQGAQRLGMGRELHATHPVFAAAFDAVAAELTPGLREVMWGSDAEALSRTGWAQPALFAVEVALFRLLESWGVRPDYLLGHSIGEVAAAHVAGVLSLPDACALVSARARLMQALPTGGAMIAVEADEAEVAEYLSDTVALAAVNGPRSVVLSGVEADVLVAAANFADRRTSRLKVSHAFHSPLMEPMLDGFRQVLTGLTWHAPNLPIVSNLTGEPADVATPDYWLRQVREAVRFADGLRWLAEHRVGTLIEVGPGGTLAALAQRAEPDLAAVPLLADAEEPAALAAGLGRLFTHGLTLDWDAVLPGARQIDLPTYAFQRRDYWPAPATAGGDVAGLGLVAAGHPLLGAEVSLPESGGVLLTGRLTTRTQPWLADHQVRGAIVFPGTGFVELAIRAGDAVGCDRLAELVLAAPLILPERGGCQLQVALAPRADGWSIAVHSRPDGAQDWTRHATGHLTTGTGAVAEVAWPPTGAELDLTGLYAGDGEVVHGPAFQGLRRAWADGDRVWAEVELPQIPADGYGVHPALLDAVLHTAVFAGPPGAPRLPFHFADVVLAATGASRVRVCLTRTGPDAYRIDVADRTGEPVLSIGTLAVRPLPDQTLAADDTAVLVTEWIPVTAPPAATPDWLLVSPAAEADGPGTVLLTVPPADPARLRETTSWVLSQLQRFTGRRVVVLTRGAVAAEGPLTDLPGAAVWGLTGAAQSEAPGLITLIDLDPAADLDLTVLAAAVATGEPRLAVRTQLLAPRLARRTPAANPVTVEGPVLITGGTGGLGGLLARHLARAHGVRDLVLLSRRGSAPELVAELAELGATATVVACDAADRDALAAVLAEHPVRGVVHAAGVVDDGVLDSLTPDRLAAVLAPKAEAAWHLHELLGDVPLFAVFSSLAGVLGNAGQGNYAAANTFLDALIHLRRDQGLSGISLAWGAWAPDAGLTAALSEVDRRRLDSSGLPPLSVTQGLALFDQALGGSEPVLGLTRLDTAALRAGGVPALLRGLVRTGVERRVAEDRHDAGFAHRWADTPAADRPKLLLGLVRGHTAAALGHPDQTAVAVERQFKELGFDSLTALDLRNRLTAATALTLPATLAFDYPTVTALAEHLADLLGADRTRDTVLPTVVSTAEDPIVVVGMACRLPGGVRTPDELWDMVFTGRDGVTEFPADRGWDLDYLLGPDGASVTAEGGFLHDAAEFDAAFFGISPREALATDPQQRLLLETSWEALENAGIEPRALAGSQTGVFMGAMPSNYIEVAGRSGADLTGQLVTGGSLSVVSGRVSYVLGLHGPAVTVDTACSSSLVALHWAAQALRSGECGLALVGGVTVMATPDAFIGFSVQGGLALDGRCKAFADAADGTGWAEGAGVLVVQRLSDAQREGRRVLAVLRGSAVNQDGASNGLTAPNGPAQQKVIRQALAGAGLRGADIDVVEAHGTGTVLGDPIEAQALLATYGQDRERPLYLGSLKSNVGHTQAAAGVAGMIKMIMAMRHGVLPPTLHVDAPSTRIDWSGGDVRLLTEPLPWPETGRPRRAAVSSFGVSGTNAHVIIEAPAPAAPPAERAPVTGVLPWVLSGRSAAAVRAQAARLLAAPEVVAAEPVDVGWTLAARTRFEHRAVLLGADRDELLAGLRAVAEGERAVVAPGGEGLAVLFSGQGAQRLDMGKALHQEFPVFAEAFDAVATELDPGLRAVMWGEDAETLARTGWAQLALFTVEVAAYRLLESFGVRPDYLLGHSVGEVAAAHVAGVLSLPDACALVSARARLMQALPAGGAMIAVEATEAEITAVLSDRVALAAVNGPDSVVLSGTEADVLAAAARFADRRTSRLKVSHAFHSPLVEPMLAEFAHVLAGLDWQAPRLPIVSNLTGEPAEVATPDYWVRQAREAVRFADGLDWLAANGVRTLVEVGPGSTLSALAQRTTGVVAVPLTDAPLPALARLHERGVALTWDALLPNGRQAELPGYAFQREHFWPDPAATTDVAGAGLDPAGHPLLSATVALPDSGGVLFTGRLAPSSQPWLADHRVRGTILFPGAGLVELALRAGDAVGCDHLAELVLEAPLALPGRGCQIQVALTPQGNEWALTVHSRPDGAQDWTRHATGRLGTTTAPVVDLPWPPTGAEIDLSGFYADGGDLAYGPAFQGLRRAWVDGDRVWAEVELPGLPVTGYGIHPALFDAVLHAAACTGASTAQLPFVFGGVTLFATGASTVRVCLTRTGPDTFEATVTDPAGAPVLTLGSVVTRPLPAGDLTPRDTVALTQTWVPVPAAAIEDAVHTTDLSTLTEPARTIVLTAPTPDGPVPAAAHEIAKWTLAQLQHWLAEPQFAQSHLVFRTSGAVSTGPEDPITNLPAATAWGLLATAQSEHPGRITLLDTDSDQLATADEPQLALRAGTALAPRLVRAAEPERAPVDGPVLITGGTGGLGGLLAKHLVTEYGIGELLLVSRRGQAPELTAELTALGAKVTVAACDVSDRDALAALLAEHPVRGVVHAAGVLDDGVLTALTPDRLDHVLAPKVDAAWHLHELLGDVPLFVLFSSMAGQLGNPGQANYAAANVFLDTLARVRRQQGLAAVSMAWGAWTGEAGLTGTLSFADQRRLRGLGLPPLAPEQGLALFDQALNSAESVLTLTRLDATALRANGIPPLLRALVPGGSRRIAGAAADADFARRWADTPAADRPGLLTGLVRGEVAAVLGHTAADRVEITQAFKDQGFDSLTAVELRNRLTAATGLPLSATLVFDYPSVTEVAAHLAALLGDGPAIAAPVAARASDEPIAIVGMACRFPGGVETPDELWDLVAQGRDAITGFPADRGWDLDALAGPSVTAHGGFLDGVAEFDAAFFGISPREALATDPQQRLLLETSWEALEHAGLDPAALTGQPVGVFAGAFQSGYTDIAIRSTEDIAGHLITGGSQSVVSGRIAYSLGLQGPAMTVDTACSSSLVALHLAAQALRAGECPLALVGGVTVMATPNTFIGFSAQGGLAGDGRCKAYADSADGTGWSEGVGVLVVQRLSDAVREGRRVLAIVRGSAVNQDGASNGLTAPNGPSQQRVIRQALATAGLTPSEVDAVEGHGTGTVLGDPIEAQALLATYGQDRDTPLLLGSLKSNLGHTQAAAGVAGIIKMVQAMRHGLLPATLHIDEPSSKVDWTQGAVDLLTQPTPWPETSRPRRAGISSFGVSGTNAHVILEAPAPVTTPEPADSPAIPWVLSARTESALRAQAARLARHIADHEPHPAAVARTLTERTAFDHRAIVVGTNRDELLAGLRALAEDLPAPHVLLGTTTPRTGTVFVFPGQGGQWTGMALELWDSSPVFATAMADCATALSSFVDWNLREVLADEHALARVDVVQPALWAVLVSLAALWRAHGVEPAAVVGHSQGEIAAFCTAGALSLVDGARIVALRSKAIADTLAGLGGMAAVALSAAQVTELIDDRLSIAAVNGPAAVVVSGEVAALHELVARCEADQVRARIIPVDYAAHSAQVEQIADRLRTELAPITPRTADLPVYSSVTGAEFDTAQADAAYWVRNLRETVRFAETAEALAANGFRTWVEVGPHPVLTGAVQDIVPDAVVVGTLRREDGGPRQFHTALAALAVHGVPITWGLTGPRADLPAYPFQHRRYWPDSLTADADVVGAGLTSAEHPLLGARLALPGSGGVLFTGRLSTHTHPWLADHTVRGVTVFPGTGFVELLVRAGDSVGCDRLAELTLEAPLVVPDRGCQVQLVLTETDGGWTAQVHSCPDGAEQWTRHATALLTPGAAPAEPLTWSPEGAQPADPSVLHGVDGDIVYGPAFRGLRRAWSDGDQVWAEVELPGLPVTGYGIHPALLDAVLHAAAFTGLTDGGPALPFLFTDVVLHAAGATSVRALLTRTGPDTVAVTVTDPAGAPVLTIGSLLARPLPAGDLRTLGDAALLATEWTALPFTPSRWQPTEHALLTVPHTTDPDPAAVHEIVLATLTRLQRWLTEEDTHLVVLTRDAIAAEDGLLSDLPAAAVWGLIRSAQSENPGRITLVDADADPDLSVLAGLLATGEPQIALRDNKAGTPRLTRHTPDPEPVAIDGPVLITGGTGGLGGLIARHLVTAHGVTELLLLSRRGTAAHGAEDLVAELTGLGAEVTVAACDVSDRTALAAVLAEHPVNGVVHTAGVLDDGVIGSLDDKRVQHVLAPKVDAAWHLHELLGDVPLFVLFSSMAGLLGGPGQGNYAAANVFVDALAHWRQQQGLAAVSMAWGAWTTEIGLTGTLTDADLRRMARSGMPPLAVDAGLALFDQALRGTEPVLGLTRLDTTALRANGAPPLLRALAGPAARPLAGSAAADPAGFADRWAAVPDPERPAFLLDLVRAHIAAALGHTAAADINPAQALRELGFDSLTALELRNRLGAATGLTLPPTLVFDHPTAADLAAFLTTRLATAPPKPEKHSVGQDAMGKIYLQAIENKQVEAAHEFALSAAALRTKFTTAADLTTPPQVVRLSAGESGPHLVCLCPPVPLPLTGPDVYLRFAAEFAGSRRVSAVMPPGFAEDEALPATAEVLIDVLATAIAEHVGEEEFALAGASSGGVLAYEVARELERRGTPPTGVALLDSYRMNDKVLKKWDNDLATRSFVGLDSGGIGFTEISAFAWVCARLLIDWAPGGLTAPALLVRASEPLVAGETHEWQTTLDAMTEVIDVPGDHFSILETEHVPYAAEVVQEWLDRAKAD